VSKSLPSRIYAHPLGALDLGADDMGTQDRFQRRLFDFAECLEVVGEGSGGLLAVA
jgi:hypothetical protein